MNEDIRVSDADRERVAERLREHYAAGRLTSDELDERLSAALSAKTAGDLRAVMTDLPEPDPAGVAGGAGAPGAIGPQGWQTPPWRGYSRPIVAFRRGPRILPLVLIALVVAIAMPGAGWMFFGFLRVALLVWLVMTVLGMIAARRFRRHARRYWQSGQGSWRGDDWRR